MIPTAVSKKLKYYEEKLADNLNGTYAIKYKRFNQTLKKQLRACFGSSDFSAELCCRHPEFLFRLVETDQLKKCYKRRHYTAQLQKKITLCQTESHIISTLRQFRNFHQLRIIWREVNQLATQQETMSELSALAECCLNTTYQWLYHHHCQQHGKPKSKGRKQHMVIIAMGKLGAAELNLSSDIDLIFCYPESGKIVNDRTQKTNHEFFTHIGQQLMHILSTQTEEGFAYRVDMRLRPNGNSGPLVCSFAAIEQYYQDHGRDWERYALIRARVVAGDLKRGSQLLKTIYPFVYRKYLDFTTIDALRNMKQLMQRSLTLKSTTHNIKQGPGGIREIEFICHSFQLIYGGKNKSLQQHALLKTIQILKSEQYLPQKACDELYDAYLFLRRIEHLLQAVSDRQTQLLPTAATAKARLAWSMGFASWSQFHQTLAKHRKIVSFHFHSIVKAPKKLPEETDWPSNKWYTLWHNTLPEKEAINLLSQAGFKDSVATKKYLNSLKISKKFQAMRRQSEERINKFMPRLLSCACTQKDPDKVLIRVIPILESILRRTAYVVLLIENPDALKHLIALCNSSLWVAEQIAKYPVLLDEFLKTDTLYQLPSSEDMHQQLRQQLAHLPEENLEAQIEVLRYFKIAHLIRFAAHQITQKTTVTLEGSYLTQIAETILQQVLKIAWFQVSTNNQFGKNCIDGEFIIVGYGKLGGMELSPDSDLDLVFIYNEKKNQYTSTTTQTNHPAFYTKLGQKILFILQTMTSMGALYEIDMRLRPSGKSGLLVTPLDAFAQYQHQRAWIWEHQALVKARAVAGSLTLAAQFNIIKSQILAKKREPSQVKKQILDMRRKIHEEMMNARKKKSMIKSQTNLENQLFNLKLSDGGLFDIEFIAQCGVLILAYLHPQLTEKTDTLSTLKNLKGKNFLPNKDLELLQTTYMCFKDKLHHCMKEKKKITVPQEEVATMAADVTLVRNKVFTSA